MRTVSTRALYERQRPKANRSNNSVRRAYDLLRSALPRLDPRARLVEEELIDGLSASRNTVRAVLQLLADQGLVTRGPKVGTIVRASTMLQVDELVTFPELGGEVRVVESDLIAAPPMVCERLGLEDGAQVLVTDGLILDGSSPLALSTSYVPLELPGDRVDVAIPDAVAFMEERLAVCVGTGTSTVAAVPADVQTAELLAIAPGAPILWCEDLLNDMHGRPRALSQLRFRGDRVTFGATTHRRQ